MCLVCGQPRILSSWAACMEALFSVTPGRLLDEQRCVAHDSLSEIQIRAAVAPMMISSYRSCRTRSDYCEFVGIREI